MGTEILSNDLAADLKEQWFELLGEGYAPEDVSAHIIAEAYDAGELEEIDDQFDFIIPFALIQWKSGKLQSDIKDYALQLLTDENINHVESSRWENDKDLKRRLKTLSEVKTILLSECPEPTKIKKAYHASTQLQPGDLFTIQLKSGHYVLIEVIEVISDYKSQYPVCVLFDFRSNEKPTKGMDEKLSIVKFDNGNDTPDNLRNGNITFLSFSEKNSEPLKRIQILEKDRIIKDYKIEVQRLTEWRLIDKVLEEWISK